MSLVGMDLFNQFDSFLDSVKAIGKTRIDKERWKVPQGGLKWCLFSSLASAFAHMGHRKIADNLVANMGPLIEVDAKSKWKDSVKILENMKDEILERKFTFKD